MSATSAGHVSPPGRLDWIRERASVLSERRVPTIVLAVLVMVLTWTPRLTYPTPGLDPSWGGGLYFAIEQGLDFGDQFVFTYGPLGFLNIPVNWDTDLATISFLWLATLHLLLCFSLIAALRRSIGAPLATLVSFLVIAEMSFNETAFVLGIALSFAALRLDRGRHSVTTLAIVGAAFAAIMTLVKLSIGPPLVAIFVVSLIGARARRWEYAAFAGTFVVAFLALWLITGQELGDLPGYVTNGREIISGYSEAMVANDGSDWVRSLAPLAAALVAIGFTAGAWFTDLRDARARLFGTLAAAIFAFSLFKEGVVRMDLGHLLIYFSTMALAWFALPWSRQRRLLLAGGGVALSFAALAISFDTAPSSVRDPLNAWNSVKIARSEIDQLLRPGERTYKSNFARGFVQSHYAVEQPALDELEGHTVAVEPAEIALTWAYELDWDPLPVIQGYSAYTSELDELNADAVADPDGPERIVRANTGKPPGKEGQLRVIDGRFPAWDPPATAIAELCNFVPLDTTDRIQVLGRVPDRCSEPRPIGSVESAYGETVDVPEAGPGEVVFVRIEGAEVSGLESLRSLLYRAKMRSVLVNGERRYRLVPGTSGDGLMLRGDPRVVGTGPFAQAPQAETISLDGTDGDLRFDFYAMSVEDAPGDWESDGTHRRKGPEQSGG